MLKLRRSNYGVFAGLKSEIRNPNLEIRNKSEMQNPNVPNGSLCLGFGFSSVVRSFEFVSNFDIRVSDLIMYFSADPTRYPTAFRKCPQ